MSRRMQLKRLKIQKTVYHKARETAHVTYPPRKYFRFSYFFYASALSAAAEETPFSYTPLGRI